MVLSAQLLLPYWCDMKLVHDFGVRAWLATIVVAPTVAVLFKHAWNGNEYAIVTLVGMSGGIIGWYFYQRRQSNPTIA